MTLPYLQLSQLDIDPRIQRMNLIHRRSKARTFATQKYLINYNVLGQFTFLHIKMAMYISCKNKIH